MAELLLVLTGARGTAGGIAANNENLVAAAVDVAKERALSLRLLLLLESTNTVDYPDVDTAIGCDGRRVRLVINLVRSLPKAALVVFDHVGLAKPMILLTHLFRIPWVVLAHGSEAGGRMSGMGARTFSHATLVLSNSRHTLQRLESRVPQVRARCCELALPGRFAMDQREDDRLPSVTDAAGRRVELCSPFLLIVGRLDASEGEKGHFEVVEALSRLAGTRPELRLVVVGGGELALDVKRKAVEFDVGSKVLFSGVVGDGELVSLYRSALVFVMPSRQEGFGLAFAESMYFGTPCIAHTDGGATAMIDHKKNGLLMTQRGGALVSELVEGLEWILERKGRVDKLARAAADTVRIRFLSHHGVARYRNELEHVFKG